MFFSLIHACQDSHNYITESKSTLLPEGMFLTVLATILCCMYNGSLRMSLLFSFRSSAPSCLLAYACSREDRGSTSPTIGPTNLIKLSFYQTSFPSKCTFSNSQNHSYDATQCQTVHHGFHMLTLSIICPFAHWNTNQAC